MNIKSKKILTRVDLDLPISNKKIINDKKINNIVSDINYLVRQEAKVILASHLGNPNGKVKENLRLDPIAKKLANELGKTITKVDSISDAQKTIPEMNCGDILLLENMKFIPEDKINKDEFVNKIVKLGDLYIDLVNSDISYNFTKVDFEVIKKFLQKEILPKNKLDISNFNSVNAKPKEFESVPYSKRQMIVVGDSFNNYKLKEIENEIKSNILPVKSSDISFLNFPIGHPKNNVVYVGNPADWKEYYPISNFHKFVFEHKFVEIIDLLAGLGATKIEVERVEGYSSEFISEMKGGVSDQNLKIETNYKKDKKTKAIYKAVLPKKDSLIIPEGLTWFPNEPTWQHIAKSRKEYGLEEFSLNLEYNNDFGIDANLHAKFLKYELTFKADFKKHRSTNWKIKGEF